MDVVLLAVEGLCKAYGKLQALDGVDLDVREGEVHALLGTNGAGKTTLLRILLGIHRADSGRVTWAPGLGPRSRAIGYLPEERGLQQDVPIERTLVFLGRLRGLSRADARLAAARWLERLELSGRAGERLDALSKGNQQKVQLAGALLHEPRLALLDEPFSGFDPVNQELLLELIDELRERGTTVLLSAHQLELVERACDRVSLLHRGRIAVSGPLDELRAQSAGPPWLRLEPELGPDGAIDPARIAALPGIAAVEAAEGQALRVRLEPGVRLEQALSTLAGALPLRGIAVERTTLHELYLGTVRSGAEAEDA